MTKFNKNPSITKGDMEWTQNSRLKLMTLNCDLDLELFVELLFNDMSTIVGHFVSSPRERKKRDRRASRGEEKEK